MNFLFVKLDIRFLLVLMSLVVYNLSQILYLTPSYN